MPIEYYSNVPPIDNGGNHKLLNFNRAINKMTTQFIFLYLHIHTQQMFIIQNTFTNTDSQTLMGTFKILYRFSEIVVTCDYRDLYIATCIYHIAIIQCNSCLC